MGRQDKAEHLIPMMGGGDEEAHVRELVQLARTGHRDAFGRLYSLYFDRVYNYLRVLLNDPHEAEDATQQVFLRVFAKLDHYEPRETPFRAWLFAVVRNYAINHLRKLNRVEAEDPARINRRREALADNGGDLRALEWITDRDLLLLIERLSIPQRQVLLLRFMLDLKTDDVATILNRSPADVRSLQHRATRFLHSRLVSLGREPELGGHSEWRGRMRQARVVRDRRFALQR